MSIINAISRNSCLKEKCQKCLRGEQSPCDKQCPLYKYKKGIDKGEDFSNVFVHN